jgi:hypothetical protein
VGAELRPLPDDLHAEDHVVEGLDAVRVNNLVKPLHQIASATGQ